jgi:hypothetical protein
MFTAADSKVLSLKQTRLYHSGIVVEILLKFHASGKGCVNRFSF